MEAPPSAHPFVGRLDCFHLLVIVPSAAVNMCVQSPLWDLAFSDFAYTSRSGISGSYGISIFIFLRNSWTFPQQLHYICEVGRVTRAGAHWEMLFSFPPQHLLKEPRWNSTPNISQPAAWCEKGWGSLEAAFFPGALPPTIAALSLFGNWSLEAGPKPTSSDIPVYPRKKAACGWIRIKVAACCPRTQGLLWPIVTFKEPVQRAEEGHEVYTHAYFSFPTSIAGALATGLCPTRGSFEASMGLQGGGGAQGNPQAPTVPRESPQWGP